MSEFEDIQRLIRLKRHEQPPPGFVEEFVSSFQERQRSELLRNSARGLLWERVTTYMEGLLNPKWAWAGATAAAVLGLGVMLRPASTGAGQIAQSSKTSVQGVQQKSFHNKREAAAWDADVKQFLMSQHYGGGFGDERLMPNGQAYAVGFNVDLAEFNQR
jgi:hypothetical protein